MERIKLALLAVIAASVASLAWGNLVGDAHAANGPIVCEAFFFSPKSWPDMPNPEKNLEVGRAHANTFQSWLETNPGTPVFGTILTRAGTDGLGGNVFGQVDIVCVQK